jgi:hypothetical protein
MLFRLVAHGATFTNRNLVLNCTAGIAAKVISTGRRYCSFEDMNDMALNSSELPDDKYAPEA